MAICWVSPGPPAFWALEGVIGVLSRDVEGLGALLDGLRQGQKASSFSKGMAEVVLWLSGFRRIFATSRYLDVLSPKGSKKLRPQT